MNELLQKHGCSAVFTVPEGLKELMGDISREVRYKFSITTSEHLNIDFNASDFARVVAEYKVPTLRVHIISMLISRLN